jgi:P27 family predicted phage terminase small subunit
MSRPRTPSGLHRLRGTWRADRHGREPQPPLGAPPPSARLPRDVRECYRRITRALAGLRVLGRPDGMIVELTAWALADHARLATLVRELGESYETTSENGSKLRRQRPEVALTNQAWQRVVTGLRELGLSPVSRDKVETLLPIPSVGPDPLERLRRRAQPGQWKGLISS